MAKLKIEITALAAGVSRVVSQVKNQFVSLGTTLKNAFTSTAGMLGLGLSVGALVAFSKKTIDAAGNISEMSRNLGLSTEEFQKLSYASEQCGASSYDMINSMRKMTSIVEDAKDGSSSAVLAFDKLGISLDELEGKSTFEQFSLIADALTQVTDKSQRAALAQDVFGKGEVKMIEVAANYREFGQELENIGGIMKDDNLEAADAFNDSLSKLVTTIQAGLINSGLVKWLADVAEGMNAVYKKQPEINDISGGYKKAGIFRNIADAFLPAGGTQFTMGISEDEQKKLDEDRKRRKVSGKTFGEEKNAEKIDRQAKAEAIKKEKEDAKELSFWRDEDEKRIERSITAEENAQKSIQDKIKSLNQELAIQGLINAGKEKEAAIQKAINDAENSAKRKLTDDEKAQLVAAQGALFDASKKQSMPTQPPFQAAKLNIEKIGGGVSGLRDINTQTNLQKQTNQLITDIKTTLNNINTRLTTNSSNKTSQNVSR